MGRKNSVLCIAAVLVMCCGNIEQPDDIVTAKHVRYFGFALTDYVPDSIRAIDSFVNLVDFSLTDFSPLDTRFDTFAIGDNSVLIHLQGIFIDPVADLQSPTGVRYRLLPDYMNRFEQWCTNNARIPVEKIAAFTIADEPSWNRMDMDDLARLAQVVKSRFPSVAIMVIEGSESIEGLRISADVDWLGVDRYGTLNPENDREYLNAVAALKRKFPSGKGKIVVVMETQWRPLYSELGYTQSVLVPMCKSYAAYASRDPDVVALIAYLLPSNFDESGQKGFLDLDGDVKRAVKQIGLQIVSR